MLSHLRPIASAPIFRTSPFALVALAAWLPLRELLLPWLKPYGFAPSSLKLAYSDPRQYKPLLCPEWGDQRIEDRGIGPRSFKNTHTPSA